jgi:nucleoside phosphorylase
MDRTESIEDIIAGATGCYLRSKENEFHSDIKSYVLRRSVGHQVGIITALPHEFNAVSKAFGDSIELDVPPALFSILKVSAFSVMGKNGRQVSLVAVLVLKMGNNAAAVAATATLIMFPSITELIVCGIGGGIPSIFRNQKFDPKLVARHVRLGDVVIGTEGTIQYDMVAKTIAGEVAKSTTMPASARATGAANKIQVYLEDRHRPWEITINQLEINSLFNCPDLSTDIIQDYEIVDGQVKPLESTLHHPPVQKGRRPSLPYLHFGKIGSANILLKDPNIRDHLCNMGIHAVEMEGSGVADAAWHFGVQVIVVRGICDYCDFRKGDSWQRRASAVAAAVTRTLVEEMY